MREILKQLEAELRNERELLAYYRDAITIQKLHPEFSEEIARKAFDQTHPASLSFPLSNKTKRLRDEFGALEAPGLPDDDTDADNYRDALWRRLGRLVGENSTLQSIYPETTDTGSRPRYYSRTNRLNLNEVTTEKSKLSQKNDYYGILFGFLLPLPYLAIDFIYAGIVNPDYKDNLLAVGIAHVPQLFFIGVITYFLSKKFIKKTYTRLDAPEKVFWMSIIMLLPITQTLREVMVPQLHIGVYPAVTTSLMYSAVIVLVSTLVFFWHQLVFSNSDRSQLLKPYVLSLALAYSVSFLIIGFAT